MSTVKHPDVVVEIDNFLFETGTELALNIREALRRSDGEEIAEEYFDAVHGKRGREVAEASAGWVRFSGQLTVATPKCGLCDTASQVTVDADAAIGWAYRGQLLQNAFPTWTADQRELLKSGTHPACWEKMVPSEE